MDPKNDGAKREATSAPEDQQGENGFPPLTPQETRYWRRALAGPTLLGGLMAGVLLWARLTVGLAALVQRPWAILLVGALFVLSLYGNYRVKAKHGHSLLSPRLCQDGVYLSLLALYCVFLVVGCWFFFFYLRRALYA